MNIKNLKTKLGNLKIEISDEGQSPSILIKLNNCPIILLEEGTVDNKDRLILKKYHNNKVIQDNDYINYAKYGVDLEEVSRVEEELLKILNDGGMENE